MWFDFDWWFDLVFVIFSLLAVVGLLLFVTGLPQRYPKLAVVLFAIWATQLTMQAVRYAQGRTVWQQERQAEGLSSDDRQTDNP